MYKSIGGFQVVCFCDLISSRWFLLSAIKHLTMEWGWCIVSYSTDSHTERTYLHRAIILLQNRTTPQRTATSLDIIGGIIVMMLSSSIAKYIFSDKNSHDRWILFYVQLPIIATIVDSYYLFQLQSITFITWSRLYTK